MDYKGNISRTPVDELKNNYRLREFIVLSVRSGVVYTQNPTLCVRPPSIDQIIASYDVYQESFTEAQDDEIMTVEETEKWMRAMGLWQKSDDNELEQLPKDIEDVKCKLYENRNNEQISKHHRMLIKVLERKLSDLVKKKNAFYTNTCESYAESNRLTWLLKQTTYKNNKLYDIDHIVENVVNQYQDSMLPDNIVRYLVRNEPWRSIWSTAPKGNFKLFFTENDIDATLNQKNFVLWAQTYDSLHESLEPPSNDVIEDDYLLDGWFISQRRKRDRERKQRELESTSKNAKINEAKEVFIVPKSTMSNKDIQDLNDPNAMLIKHQRNQAIKNKGSVSYDQLPDVQLDGRRQMNEQFKNHVKRK